MNELFEIYLEASGGKYGDENGLLAVRDHILKEHDRKYNELVALIWHKIGNGEDGATPIEKLISDFSDEHYKLFNTFRDCESTIVDLTKKLDRAERASVPVKVRWDVTAEEACDAVEETVDRMADDDEIYMQSTMHYLAAHAVVDAPAGVPSVVPEGWHWCADCEKMTPPDDEDPDFCGVCESENYWHRGVHVALQAILYPPETTNDDR